MIRAPACALALIAVVGCKARRDAAHDETVPVETARDPARDAAGDAIKIVPWPELATFPLVEPLRVIAVPSRVDAPRFEVGGPALLGDVAVVASSQFGFAAVDWRRGALVWTKPAGLHVAPPLALGTEFVLIGECVTPPAVPEGQVRLGCLRVVTALGADESYTAIHGVAGGLDRFVTEAGPQQLWPDGEHAVRWRRGDQAVSIDLLTGIATRAAIAPPPIVVSYKGRTWDVEHVDERIVARDHGTTKIAWQTQHGYGELLGAVLLRDQAPMIRTASVRSFHGLAELNLLDIDATGSLHGQAAFPVPALSLLGFGTSRIGDVALAVRLDTSLQRDFIVGYAANALLMYVYPLPGVPRADPIGIAIASDAVVAFHDGDTVTVLPELSTPPTAPGAPRAPSQNPTP